MNRNQSSTLFVSSTLIACVSSYFLYRYMFKSTKKYKVIFVIGGPGSGKGLNSSYIEEHYGYKHLSTGDLLRAESMSDSELSKEINSYIRDGKLVPSEITVRLLLENMSKSATDKFIIDGFPRDENNLLSWNKLMKDQVDLQFILYLHCPPQVMMNRLLERAKINESRKEDNVEGIKKRLATFNEFTQPILEKFRHTGKLREVDANRPIELVYADVSMHFENFNSN